ncbi:hypothetical protein SAMN05421839_11262 [Halolactibacillus halophilus]|uniref:TspO/MBR family protein n=1 Tax=Halolactibacillus halophilus TaxID=306540 RepID=A0A1I5P3L9_9BACI|nr:tryptophan-rich sensory protein [Halolactibacillus halophilus]GEM01502.1 hypothetical protein HHA03_10340 [Halolactibacillus halophilus]SFP28655.1 hypothetical protein SAMN05421839_11262 [Halolactibacillus halophilus]
MIKIWLNVFTLIFALVLNGLATALPLNDIDTGAISDRLNVLFTPAGYVFSIWGIIYIALVIWTFRQFKSDQQNRVIYRDTHVLFWLINLLNGIWLITWHYFYFGIGVVIMLLLLVLLIGMYNVINQVKDKPLDRLPFSLYLGWISVATIANISYYLTEIGWNGFGISDEIWTVALLVIAFMLATWFRYSQSDIVYPLVFIWALIGVGIKNQGVSELVSMTSFIVSGLLVIVILFVRKKKHTLSFSR